MLRQHRDVLLRRGGVIHLHFEQLKMDAHRVERILHLVRDARRHAAECGQSPRHARPRNPPLLLLVGQAGTDHVEGLTQFGELVLLWQREGHAGFAATQAREAGANQQDGPQCPLRQ